MLIFYGIDGNKKEVTEICLNQLTRDNIITIPHNDNVRAAIFGDNVYGVEKKVFVLIEDKEYEYDKFQTIRINLTNMTINVYSAVIVEFRQHKALRFVLTNFLNNLSDEWNIIIFCGNLNSEFVDDMITKLASKRITKYQLNIDNLLPHEYSKLLMENYIYDMIPTETFLIFQTDSVILEDNKDKINQFLHYDYVGAPWGAYSDDVGNGGLSLRKKSKMLEIIKKDTRKDLPEDLFFAQTQCIALNKPDQNHALSFSIENWHGNNHPFGCHKPWGLMGIESEFCQMHPEIIILYNLQ